MCLLRNSTQVAIGLLILFSLLVNTTTFALDQNNEYMLKGWEYYKENKFDEAINELTNVIKTDPLLTGAYILRGLSYFAQGNNESAISDLSRAIKDKPESAKLHFVRGLAYTNVEEYELAIADSTYALKLMPDLNEARENLAVSYRLLAIKHSQKNEFDQVVSACNKAINLNSDDDLAYQIRSGAYFKKRAYDQAISDCNEIMRIKPKDALNYAILGSLFYEKKELDTALMNYSKAIQLNPNIAIFYRGRGEVYHDKGNLKSAKDDYTKAISLDTNDGPAYSNRGFVYLLMNDYKNALIDMLRAKELGIKLEPEFLERIRKVVEIDAAIQSYDDRKNQIKLERERLEIIGAYFSDVVAQQRQREMIRYQAEQQAYYNSLYARQTISLPQVDLFQKKQYKVHYNFDGSEATIREQ